LLGVALFLVRAVCLKSTFCVPCRRFRFSKKPIIKNAFDKNPRRTTGNKSEAGASLFFQAATTRRGLIRLNAIRGFLEAYDRWFEE